MADKNIAKKEKAIEIMKKMDIYKRKWTSTNRT